MKKRFVLFLLVGLCTLFLCRQPLLELAVKGVGSFLFSKGSVREWTYESVKLEQGKLVFAGTQFLTDDIHLAVDRLEVDFHLTFSPLYFETHVRCMHPQITLLQGTQVADPFATLAVFVPSERTGIKWDMDHGVLLCEAIPTMPRLYFLFQSGEKKEEIGTLSLAYDPSMLDMPALTLKLEKYNEHLQTACVIQHMEVDRLFQFLSFFHPLFKEKWEETQGNIEMSAEAIVALNGHIEKIQCAFELNTLSLAHETIRIKSKHLQGNVSYPAENSTQSNRALPQKWKEVIAHIDIQDAELHVEGFAIHKIDGHLTLDPALDPAVDIKGVLSRSEKEIPFSLTGQGGMEQAANAQEEDSSFWVEITTRLETRKKDPCSLFLSLCAPEKETLAIQANLTHFSEEEWEIFQGLISPQFPRLMQGRIEGNMTALMKGERFEIAELSTRLDDGEVSCGERGTFSHVDIEIKVQDNKLQPSSIKGVFLEMPLQVALREWIVEEDKRASLYGSVSLQAIPQESIDFGLEFSAVPLLDKHLFPHLCNMTYNGGWLRSENITLGNYPLLVKSIDPQMSLTAKTDLFGNFDQDHLVLSIQATDVHLRHPHFSLYAEAIGEKDPLLLKTKDRAHIAYRFEQNQWESTIPLSQARLSFQDLVVDHMEGKLHLTGSGARASVWIEELSAHSVLPLVDKHVHLAGFQATADIDANEHIVSVTKLSSQLLVDETESYTLSSPNLLFSLNNNERWEFDIGIKEGLKEMVRLVGHSEHLPTHRAFIFDEKRCHFGRTTIEKMGFSVYPDGMLAFEVKGKGLKVGPREIASFHFKGDKQQEQWTFETFHVDDLKASCALKVDKERVAISNMSAYLLRHHMRAEGSYLLHKRQFVGKISTLSIDLEEASRQLELKLSSPLTGTLTSSGGICVTLDDTYSQWKAEGNVEMAYAVKKPFPVVIQSEKPVKIALSSEGKVEVGAAIFRSTHKDKAASLQLAACHFDRQKKDTEIKLAHFSLSSQLLQKLAQAELIPPWLAELRAELPLSGSGQLNMTAAEGIVAKGELAEGAYLFAKQSWPLKQIHLRYGANTFHIGCKTAWNQLPLYAHVQIDNLSSGGGLLPLGMLHVSEHPQKEGLKLFFKQRNKQMWSWEKVEGALSGLEVHLTHNGSSRSGSQGSGLQGSVKGDLALVSRLLSKEAQDKVKELKLGKGYELIGNFTLFENDDPVQFEGSIRGREIECLGYHLRTLDAEARIARHTVVLRRLMLKDEAGEMAIKQIRLEERDGKWFFDVPLIQVENFRPSTLRSIADKSSSTKPLTVKKLRFVHFSGQIGDPQTFTGEGELNFTNAFKKESHFLDQPLELIKNLGLDPGLLTPVYGEIAYRFEEGKIRLIEMQNTHSEGKRSEFALSDDGIPSYIDLDGNLHVNLRMKQNVVLKVTEPFILTVRGTWKKPRYGLE